MTLEDYLLNHADQPYQNRPIINNNRQSPEELIANDYDELPKPEGLADSVANAVRNQSTEVLAANADIGYGNIYGRVPFTDHSKINAQTASSNYYNRQNNGPLQAITVGADLSKNIGPTTVGLRGNTQLDTDNSTVGYNVRVPISNSNINYEANTIRGTGIPTQYVRRLGLDSKDIAGIDGLAGSMVKESSQYNDSPKEVNELMNLQYSPNNNITFFANKNKLKVDGDVVNKGNQIGAEYKINDNGTISLTRTADDNINNGKPQIGISGSYRF